MWRHRQTRTADSAPFLRWLNDRGSLTARLQALGQFSLARLKQELAAPTPDEARELVLGRKRPTRVREVVLLCDGKPLVFAHTVLPCRPRGPLSGWLERLGDRSLGGTLLFCHAGFSRGPLLSRRLDARDALFQPAVEALQLADHPPRTLWARRSRFSFGRQSVLVTEVFSPALEGKRTPSSG